MGNGSLKPGDAVADRSRDEMRQLERGFENAVQKLHIRADMRSNPDEQEDTGVIERRALEAQRKKDSEPPSGRAKAATAVLKLLPEGWGRVIVVLAGIAAATYLAGKGLKLF